MGREAELTALRERIVDARAGQGGVVLVAGPAGIGKSTLVDRAVRDLEPSQVTRGWGVADATAPVLWPWRDALGMDAVERAAVLEPGSAQFLMLHDAAGAVCRLGAERLHVCVLEDFHWADELSVRLLRHVAGQVGTSRLLVVVTTRRPSDGMEARRSFPGGAGFETMPPVHWVHLGPLSATDVAAYATAVYGRPSSTAQLRGLVDRCGGNPLFLRALTDPAWAPAYQGSTQPVGASALGHLVHRLLADLPADVRTVLNAGAALGERIDAGLLATSLGRSPTHVTGMLDVAARAGVVAG